MSDIKKLDLTDERREVLMRALSDAANAHDRWMREIYDGTLVQLEETTADRIIDQLTMTRKEYAATMNRL